MGADASDGLDPGADPDQYYIFWSRSDVCADLSNLDPGASSYLIDAWNDIKYYIYFVQLNAPWGETYRTF